MNTKYGAWQVPLFPPLLQYSDHNGLAGIVSRKSSEVHFHLLRNLWHEGDLSDRIGYQRFRLTSGRYRFRILTG